MKISTLDEIENELERFKQRLDDAKKRIQGPNYYPSSGCKETAALKRSALDLKNELTKLNKSQYD